jgi:asparagine synthase (glutamine-hydrolysing)
MCGIVGILVHGRGAVHEPVLTQMRDTMVHRGPDGGGNWISSDAKVGLAHRRLSIIDLSTDASQPMTNEDRSVWITFNGEIYNHARLRPELMRAGHRFVTDHSDTEVLVHGYEQWGLDGLLDRIAGDYAFAIWDASTQTLNLARDRIGVKPLYFSLQKEAVIFGSEIKAILEHPDVERDVDAMAMYHYLTFMSTPAPLTLFRNVYKLPAGFRLKVQRDGKIEPRRYWDAVPGQGIPASETRGLSDSALEDFYVQGIRTHLRDAVDCRMMSDVPFGVFLSGGIDSSMNVALMSEFSSSPVETFTVGFKDHVHLNELDEATLVAKKFGTRHHEILIDEKDMFGYLNDLIYHQDEPIADWVCIPLYFVSKLTRDSGVTVVQVGEGSDEQFCGYRNYMEYLRLYRTYWKPFQTSLPKFAQRGLAAAAAMAASFRPGWAVYADIVDRGARNREHFWTGATVFWDSLKRPLVRVKAFNAYNPPGNLTGDGFLPESYFEPDSYNIIRSFLEPFDAAYPGQDVLTRMIYNEFKHRLPELLLMRVDKISMSESLEARVPFLDHRLVEFTMDIPMEWKTRDGVAKYLLKKVAEGIIPHETIYRKKMGFGAPMSQWLKSEFGNFVETSILSSGLIEAGYFNEVHIRKLFADHRSGRLENAVYIWVLFNLTAWYGYWIEGKEVRAA